MARRGQAARTAHRIWQHRRVIFALRSTILALCLLLLVAASANAKPGDYTECGRGGEAIEIYVSGAACEEARGIAVGLAGTQPAGFEASLVTAGWTPIRARAFTTRDIYDIIAVRGLATLLLSFGGLPPDLDGWTGGRELVFSAAQLVPGTTPPKGSTLCTSAFLVRLGTRQGGLSAAHCAGFSKRSHKTRRRNSALRRAPQPGVVLGGVRRNLARRAKPVDALVLPVPSGPGRPSAAIIDRGILLAPWFVRGRARPRLGRQVCFTGIASGPDNCGTIIRPFPGTRGLTCTTIRARSGDSGSPVYTPPAADGTVRAVGIASVVVGLFETMCFVPIDPVLDALHATLVSAPG